MRSTWHNPDNCSTCQRNREETLSEWLTLGGLVLTMAALVGWASMLG